MSRYFSLEMPFSHFLRNVTWVSLALLLPLLALYVVFRPGFGAMLFEGGPALSRFLRQVATNGLPVVIVVNYIGFFHYARSRAGPHWQQRRATFVLADMATRLIAFFLLHVIIYAVSADWFGSFGGSKVTALRVVAPTLARAALFENISGVYLYAVLLSALPVYAEVLDAPRDGEGPTDRPPDRAVPWLAALGLCVVLAFALTATAWGIVQLQSG